MSAALTLWRWFRVIVTICVNSFGGEVFNMAGSVGGDNPFR